MSEEEQEKKPAPAGGKSEKTETLVTKKKKKKKKRKSADKAEPSNNENGKGRPVRNFPASTFQDAMLLAEAFQKYAAGQLRVRKLTLFDKMGKSPDSGPSRQLITNSSRYALTKGSYKAEFLELTPEGALASADDVPDPQRLQARFDLAIKNISPFKLLYDRCKGGKMPSKEFLIDALQESQPDEEAYSECVDTFILNVQFLGLLRTIAGSERLITIEHGLEEASKSAGLPQVSPAIAAAAPPSVTTSGVAEGYDSVCFYITPIGSDDSEQRKHADFFMEYVIAPAIKEFDLRLVRADQIGKPGMIGKQVLEHILHSRLVIADLSFHNPNVFYELCLRHATRLPTVQIIRASESIPFDINQYRTAKIDMQDLYGFLPKLQTYISEIANQVRMALKDPDAVDSPISLYYPSIKLTWNAA
jgi:hypothetical protein